MRFHRALALGISLALTAGCISDENPSDGPTIVVSGDEDAAVDTKTNAGTTSRDDTGTSVSVDTNTPTAAPDTGTGSSDTGRSTSPDTGIAPPPDLGSADDTSSPDPCPPNAHQENGDCYCDDGYVVNEDRTACVRECTQNSECSGTLVCKNYECQPGDCSPGSCGPGLTCQSNGDCTLDPQTAPSGSPPACSNVPNWECTGSNCGELIQFNPSKTNAWWDYPLNGESATNQYRSWARRDLVQLIKYATAKTACQSKDWSLGNGGPLGLGDMSEKDGAIPGTSTGNPGHPQGTHTDGYDIDVAYYQAGTPDNRLRPVCEHTLGGRNEYHCVASPTELDVWRTALFLAHLHVTPQLRVIGVDGRIGPLVESAIQKLCNDGWVRTSACSNPRIAYEVTDNGRGWFRFHHHHAHVSLTTRSNAGFSNLVTPPKPVDEVCLRPGCNGISPFTPDPRRTLY